jgi:hypothetical protein
MFLEVEAHRDEIGRELVARQIFDIFVVLHTPNISHAFESVMQRGRNRRERPRRMNLKLQEGSEHGIAIHDIPRGREEN